MEVAKKWGIMVRQFPGSAPVRCKDASGKLLEFSAEDAAQATASRYREQSKNTPGMPHYFATEV